jgi:peptidylprolyl isomerase
MKNNILTSLAAAMLVIMSSCSGKSMTDEEKEKEVAPKEEVAQPATTNSLLPSEFSKSVTDTVTTASGLRVVYRKQLNDAKPAANDVVKVHYKGTLTSGSEFDNSFKRGEPIAFPLGTGKVIKGWDEGIALLGKGDMATFIIPANLAYGDRSMGNGLIPANSTLVFDVHLVDFSEGYKKYDITGKTPITTASGLKFYVIKEGDLSKKPVPGQTAIAHYAGYLTNGTKFDASFDRGQPFQFQVGQGNVIKGWDEVIQLMGIGSQYQVHIPSTLGYGERGSGAQIPGNATLIFDMELLGIK